MNPGALEKLGMYRFYYPISYLKEMLKGSSVISGSGTTGITVGVLMPTTGDATVVEHPYTMTPATAGIIPGLESAANARPVRQCGRRKRAGWRAAQRRRGHRRRNAYRPRPAGAARCGICDHAQARQLILTEHTRTLGPSVTNLAPNNIRIRRGKHI